MLRRFKFSKQSQNGSTALLQGCGLAQRDKVTMIEAWLL
jgi:hypothetical protein